MEKIEKILEFCFEHSTARAFLVFSAIFVIFSVGYAQKYVPISLFFLFYAFIAYRIVVLRKAEKWGNYAVGDWLGALMYFLIDWLFFVAWISGTILLLNKVNMQNLLSDYQYNFLSEFFVYILIFTSVIFISWIVLIFWRRIADDRKDKTLTNTKN